MYKHKTMSKEEKQLHVQIYRFVFAQNIPAFNIMQILLFRLFLPYVLTDAIDDGFDRNANADTQTVEAIESDSIVLPCGRTKMPNNSVKWLFNGKFYLILSGAYSRILSEYPV